MAEELRPNSFPASEEPLVQAFIELFFDKPERNDFTILHKNGKITRNGYEVRAITLEEAKVVKRHEKAYYDSLKKKHKFSDKYKK